MSRRTRRSSPRRSYRFSQGAQPIPRSCEPVLDRQFAPRALSGATPWPRHARSRRLPPSPPCRPDACEAMQSNCVAPTRSLVRSSALLRSECMHPPCPWQHRYRRQPDRFVSSSTPFLAWYGLEALATVRVEEDTGAVPCSVNRLCRLWAQRAQFRQRAVGENRPLSHSGRFRGHKGAGVVVDVGKGVTSVKKGDHVIPLYTPECRQCPSCLSRKTNLCTAIRATQGQGMMPDGTSRFSIGGKPIHHYMGTSTFANFTVLPEIAVAKIREDAPFDKVCYIGCGVTTGIGAVINTAKVEQGAKAIVFGLGGIGLNVLQGLKLAGADMIIGVDINNDRKAWGERFGMTHFVNPKDLGKDLVPHLVNMTKSGADQIGGADYTFDCTGNVTVMRQALEACHRGWGQSIIIGVAPAGAEISTRPFQLVTGRVWKGTAFGGARGRTDVPKIVDWYMQGKIEIDPLITHKMPLDKINDAFDLMHAGTSIRSVITY